MSNLNFTADSGLAQLWNLSAPGASEVTGGGSGAGAIADLGNVWQSGSTADGLQSAFALDWPANQRNMAKPAVNTSEHTTVPITRFRFGWERALTIGNLAFALLTGPGRDNSNPNAVLCTLPMANRTLRLGQLTFKARSDLANAVGTADYIRYIRRVRGFADGTLYAHDPDVAKDHFSDTGPVEVVHPDPSAVLRGMLPPFGVIQDTTGIGAGYSGSATRQPRSSVTVNGSVQTFHLWGTSMPGTRLFVALARVHRGFLGGDSLDVSIVSGAEGVHANIDYGDNDGVFAKTAAERHDHPYALIPCWSPDGRTQQHVIDQRFQFHPKHAEAIRAARYAYPKDVIAYASIGVLTHAPRSNARQNMQEAAIFDADALQSLPLSTISFGSGLV